jgi:hypothetical protein
MQIHEITIKKNTQVDEGLGNVGGDIGQMGGEFVNTARNIGGAIASPFKDVAQGYRSARQDQKVSAVADKAFRAWQNYVAQLEQSIAKQPAPVAKVAPEKQTPPTTGVAANATVPGATAPAKPNYSAQTGAGAKIAYNQPIGGIPATNTPRPTNAIGPKTPGVAVSTPGTAAKTAPGQPITVGGQKLKPGTPEYEKSANAPLRELQEPASAVSPALTAFRNRTDGKYEAYLKAFVQKNLLAGLGFRGLVNQQEIDNAIKAIAAPANADPATQRPLWNDLARACALAVPAAGALTGRDPKAPQDPNAPATTPEKQPPVGEPATAELAKSTMTKDQISQWISRNSEDHAVLKAALDAINAVKA